MIKKIFLFPHSSYLTEQWWHRLATVIFWFWITAYALIIFRYVVIGPYADCVYYGHKNCGNGYFDYIKTESETIPTVEKFIFYPISALMVYGAATLPSLAYRVMLFIAKGKSWKN